MNASEDRLIASLGRIAEQIPVSSDAWAENRRRLAGRRPTRHHAWLVPVVAAAVVAVLVTASLLLSEGPDRSTAAGPVTALGDRHFADPALENCAQQIRAGDGAVAAVADVDPAGTPIVFRLADDTLCTLFSAGGAVVGPERQMSAEVPYLAVTGGTGWMAAMGAVTGDVDRITFTPGGTMLPTVTERPTVKLGSLRAFAMRLPGAGTVLFFDGDSIVGRTDVAALSLSSDGGTTESPAVTGTDLLIPADQRLPVGVLSGPDVVTAAPLTLDSTSGRVAVVPMWGSWCGPCRDQQPGLNVAAAALADTDVRFLGLDVRDDPEFGAAFVTEFGVRYPSMTVTPEEAAAAIPGVPASSVPVTVLIDRQHRVAQVFLPVGLTGDQLIGAATALAAE